MQQSNPETPRAQQPLGTAATALDAVQDAHACLLGLPTSDRVYHALGHLRTAAIALRAIVERQVA